MDLVFPIVLLLLAATAVLAAPSISGAFRSVMFGFAVLRSELLVQASRRIYQRRQP